MPSNYDILRKIALGKHWAEVGASDVQLGMFGRSAAAFAHVVAVPYSLQRLEGIVVAGLGNCYRMVELLVGVVDIVVEENVAGIVAVAKEAADTDSGIPVWPVRYAG
jgi:hypothetical protein